MKRPSRFNSPSLMALGRLVATLLAFVSVPLIARFLGPEGRGETATAIAIFGLAPVVLSCGIHLGVRRLTAVQSAEEVVRTARVLCLLLFAPAIALALVMHHTLFSNYEFDAKVAACAVLIVSPIAISWMIDVSVLVIRSDYFGVTVVFLAQPTVMVVGLLALWGFNLISTASVIALHGSSTLITAAYSWWRVGIRVRGPRLHASVVINESRQYTGSSMAEAAIRRVDQILMLPLLGAVAVGMYSVAASVVLAPLALSQALAASFFKSIATADRRGTRTLVGEAVRSSWVAGLGSGIVMAVLAPVFVETIFGTEFAEAAILTLSMAPVAALGVVSSVQTGILNALGRGKTMFIGHVAALAVVAGGFWLLLPIWGMTAAVAVTAAANALLVMITGAGLGIEFRQMIPKGTDVARTVKIFLGKL